MEHLKGKNKLSIIFATGNDHKAIEVMQILAQDKLEFKTLKDIEYHEEIEEYGSTLKENALIKARTIYKLTGENVFADDSGLEVFALDMLPGVNTARYAGDQKDANDNMNKLLLALKDIEDRRAQFKAVMALIWEGQEYLFEGIIEGRIAQSKSGNGGFGYDPIFIPEGYDVPFAEISVDQKNAISHRYRAVSKMKKFLDTII